MGKVLPLLLVLSVIFTATYCIPTSLVDEIKSSELRDNKVKRANSDSTTAHVPEQNENELNYYNKPSATKRGTNLNDQNQEQQEYNTWVQEKDLFKNSDFNADNLQSGLYNTPYNTYDDKSLTDYEKGYRYGTDRDKLDEALENAVLKSELYGEPTRYYGFDDRRRRRRDTKKLRLKREVDLTPEEVLALLTLYESNRQQLPDSENYRQPWMRYNNFDLDVDQPDDATFSKNDEDWLEGPVYPHVGRQNDIYGAEYGNAFDENQLYDKKGRWGGFSENNKKKRFMVTKKRSNDPTRMLRYLNGPNENDFNTLSKLLSNQREPKVNVPVYRRLVL